MRKLILFISVALFLPVLASSQGKTLEFNQVLSYAAAGITTSPYTIGTVPANKVWKVEWMGSYRNSYSNSFVINTGAGDCSFYVFSLMNSNEVVSPATNGAVWLKEGDILKVATGDPSYALSYFVSIIEFNVVTP